MVIKLLIFLTCLPITANSQPLILKNAKVFDGSLFVSKDLYVNDGKFTESTPDGAATIDLSGYFILPPAADAHIHRFASKEAAKQDADFYLERGFVYAANLCGPRDARLMTSGFTNRREGADVLFANGALTGSGCHPAPLYRNIHLRRGGKESEFLENYKNNTFYFADTAKDLSDVWPKLLKTEPDLIKVILTRANEPEKMSNGSTKFGDGLSPAILKAIVANAKKIDKPVVAHVHTASDTELAVDSGVQWLAHLTGFAAKESDSADEFLIDPQLAEKIAGRGVVVIPTVAAYDSVRDPNTKAHEITRHNLARLLQANAKIIFGSDEWNGPEAEIKRMFRTGLFNSAELLRMMVQTTPQIMFPQRQIGALAPGFEATWMVVKQNPLDHFPKWQSPLMLGKQGQIIFDQTPAAIDIQQERLEQKIVQRLAGDLKKEGAPASWSMAISKDQQMVYSGSVGKSDIAANMPALDSTVYRSYSISKAITAVAVMQLVENGKVKLDDDIRKFVPAFPKKRWPIKIVHLLTHTSGIRHYKPNAGEISSTVEYPSLEKSLTVFANDPLLFRPGTDIRYTSFGFNLLTGVIEAASKMSFSEYLQKHIFEPAGMQNSGLAKSGKTIPDLATPYWLPRRIGEPHWPAGELPNVSGRYGSSGITSTAVDLVKFLNALESEKLLQAATLREMWTPIESKVANDLCLGWDLQTIRLAGEKPREVKMISRRGSGAGYCAVIVHIPSLQISGAIMANSQSDRREELLMEAIQLVIRHSSKE